MSSEWSEQPAAPDSHGVPGRILAAERAATGWSVEQVADQLKLAVRQVIALEAGDYASLPAPAVVRGFVRAYAKILKLDPAPLVAMIALDAPAASDATNTTLRRDKPAAFSEVRFPTHGKRARLPLGLIGGALLVLAAAAAAWQFGLIPGVAGGALVAPDVPAAGTESGALVSVLPAPVAGPAGSGQPAAGLKTDAPGTLQSTSVPLISVPPASSATAATPEVAVAGAAAPAAANALVLEVREDSWIEVLPAKGAPLIARLVKGGSTETVNVTGPLTLVVGKPGAVTATLRGAPMVLPPAAGSTVSRVSLK